MDKKTKNARVVVHGTSFVNGDLFTMKARGKASVPDGMIEMSWELSKLPPGFSILTLVDSTSAGVSPIFALEKNGGKNLLSLADGNYALRRTFDYGKYGSYDFNYEIRTDGNDVSSTGVQEGRVELPPLSGSNMSLVEILVPAGPREIRSFMQTTKTDEKGKKVPLMVTGVYAPLDGEADWTRRAKPQIRRSNVVIVKTPASTRLTLRYATAITPIPIPEVD